MNGDSNTQQDVLAVDLAVRRAITAYAHSVDQRDMAACAALFAEDARIQVMGEEHTGSAQIRAWLDKLAQSAPGIHLTTNTLVRRLSDTDAEAVSNVAFIRQDGGTWRILVAGTYADRLRREGDAWRFVERVITLS